MFCVAYLVNDFFSSISIFFLTVLLNKKCEYFCHRCLRSSIVACVIQVHARKKPMADDVDYMAVASMTEGMVGAELANIIEVAAINMMRDGRSEVLFDLFGIFGEFRLMFTWLTIWKPKSFFLHWFMRKDSL